MKNKIVSPLIIIILLGVFTYDHGDYLYDNAKYLVYDPANKVLNANIPELDTIGSFDNEVYGNIYLLAGTEEDYGFRHILARHTSNYFINYDNKNQNTLFKGDISGGDIMLGMDYFYEHCIEVSAYNKQLDRNIAYVGFTKLDGELVRCLLIVRKIERQIVTFYPFNEIREEELLKEREEEVERRNYYLD